MGVATSIAIGLAIASATTSVAAAKMNANTAKEGAELQTNSANHAADVQGTSAAEALAYTKQQAAIARADADRTQRANYDQWAAEQRNNAANANARIGSINALGAEYGVAARPNVVAELPGYRSSIGGAATGAGLPPAAGATAPPANGANLSDPAAWMSLVGNTAALSDWTKAGLGPTATPELVDYYVSKIKGQPGIDAHEQAGGATYWLDKMRTGATEAPARAPAPYAANAYAATPPTPAYAPPAAAALKVNPYQRRTIGDFFATA